MSVYEAVIETTLNAHWDWDSPCGCNGPYFAHLIGDPFSVDVTDGAVITMSDQLFECLECAAVWVESDWSHTPRDTP